MRYMRDDGLAGGWQDHGAGASEAGAMLPPIQPNGEAMASTERCTPEVLALRQERIQSLGAFLVAGRHDPEVERFFNEVASKWDLFTAWMRGGPTPKFIPLACQVRNIDSTLSGTRGNVVIFDEPHDIASIPIWFHGCMAGKSEPTVAEAEVSITVR